MDWLSNVMLPTDATMTEPRNPPGKGRAKFDSGVPPI